MRTHRRRTLAQWKKAPGEADNVLSTNKHTNILKNNNNNNIEQKVKRTGKEWNKRKARMSGYYYWGHFSLVPKPLPALKWSLSAVSDDTRLEPSNRSYPH